MSTPNRIQAVRDAYSNLTEEQKNDFAKAIQKNNPKLFLAWYQRAKIHGQRPARAANRPLGVGPRLDQALLKPPPQKSDLLPSGTAVFFVNERWDWFKELTDSLKDATTDNVEAKLRAKLASMEPEHGIDPFWSLFVAGSELHPDHWLPNESDVPRTGEETSGLESIDEKPETPKNETEAKKRDAAITTPEFEGKSDAERETASKNSGIFDLASLRRGEALLSAFLLAQQTTNELLGRLPGEVNNLSLTDRTLAEELSAGFQSAIAATTEAGGDAESWLSELSDRLQTDEMEYLATSEPVLETISMHAAGSRQTVDLLRNACEEVRKLLRELMSSIDARDKKMSEQLAEIRAADDLLERPRFEPSLSLPTGDLLRGIELEFKLGEQLSRARAEHAAFLIAQKVALQEQLEATCKHYDAAMLGPELEVRFQEVREAIQGIDGAESLTAARGTYEQLVEALRANPEVRSLTDLTSEAVVGSPTAVSVIPLARALNARGRASEALALLTCLQVTTEVEVSGPDDFSGMADELIRASAELANAGTPPFAWIDGVFQQSWIRDLRHSDLRNLLTWQRLAVAFVVQDHLRGTEQETDLFYRLEFQKFWPKERYPILGRLLHGIGIRQTLRVLPEAPGSQRQIIESNLSEVFRKNNHGEYLRQAGKGDHFHNMERLHLFPAMERIRQTVRALCGKGEWEAARNAADHDPDKLLRKACNEAGIDPSTSAFYRRVVVAPQTGYVPEFLQKINAFIDASVDDGPSDPEHVLVSELLIELEALESQQAGFASFWTAVRRTLSQAPIQGLHAVNSSEQLLVELLNRFGPATTLGTGFITALCNEGLEHKPARDTVEQMIRAIAEPPLDCGLTKLQTGKCYRHTLLVLDQLDPEARQQLSIEDLAGFEARLRGQMAETESDLAIRWRAVVANPRSGILEVDYQSALAAGYFGYLHKMINAAEKRISRASEEQRGEVGQWLHVQLEHLVRIKNAPSDESSEHWLGNVFDHCSQVEKILVMARSNLGKGRPVGLRRALVEDALAALDFVVRTGSQSFDEIRSHLAELAKPDLPELPTSPTPAEITIPEIATPWRKLSSLNHTDAERVRPLWEEFACNFSNSTRLYHELHQTLHFSAVKDYRWGRYSTRFLDPRSGCLDREVRLYLCLGEKSPPDELAPLVLELEQSSDFVNLVFVPSGMERIKRLWKPVAFGSPYLLIGENLLAQICAAKDQNGKARSDVPVRQAIHHAVESLTSIGLFKSEGVVDQRKNIFVGREQALQQLTQQKASVIWGGRRTGKTSLLQALSQRIQHTNIKGGPFAVAFVYGDKVTGDPDLAIARAIAIQLHMKLPESLQEFETTMLEAVGHTRIAVLIDEMDSYILRSRQHHANPEFPLARVLRGLSQCDQANRFKLVYAGFKQLYYEVCMRQSAETSFPFKNILEPVRKDFRDLNLQEVGDLMRISFTEMLGVEWEPPVPRLITAKTSGHPAFVQHFCERLLLRLSKRRESESRLRLTVEDVEATYSDHMSPGTEDTAFIDYVNDTFTCNVSALERVILMTLSTEIRATHADERRSFSASQIMQHITFWCDASIPVPDSDDIDNALHMLAMTKMLTIEGRGNDQLYRITYPAYIDFMSRLDQLDKMEIFKSLRDYDKNERGQIK